MSFGVFTAGTGSQVIQEVKVKRDAYTEGNSQLDTITDYLESELGPENEYVLEMTGHKDNYSHYVNIRIQKINR